MTMKFIIVKNALSTLLNANEAGRYQTVGYQTKSKGADEALDFLRIIQPYYRAGDFDGRRTGPQKHKVSFDLDFTVAADNKVDLSVLDDPDATDAERKAAISGGLNAADRADDLMDDFFDIIWNVVMDARNEYLGLDEITYPDLKIDNRYIDNFRKDDLVERGDLVILTAKARLTFNLTEQVSGDIGDSDPATIDNTINIDGDLGDNAGATVTNS